MKKAFIQLHLAVFLAGFTAVLGKLIGLQEGVLVWYRMLLTVLALLIILYTKKELALLNAKEMLHIFLVGGIIALHWVAFYGSVKYGNISVALVCFSATGFFTAFLEPVINKKAFEIKEALLGLLAVAGIYIIFDFHPQYKTGIIFGIIAAIGSALFPIFNKQLINKYQPGILTLYEMAGGLIVLSVLVPFYNSFFPAAYYIPTLGDIFWLLILAVVCTVFCFYLQLNALKHLSPFTANLAYNLEPVYGIVLAFVFFGESKYFGGYFYLGLALILLSVALQTWAIWRKRVKSRQL